VTAFMTTGYMLAVAKALDASAGTKLYDLTNAALSLHELHYDGLDRPGIYGRCPFVDLVADDVKRVRARRWSTSRG